MRLLFLASATALLAAACTSDPECTGANCSLPTPDAGPRDTGAADTGSSADATPSDATPTDGQAVDSGTPDSGVDAGPPPGLAEIVFPPRASVTDADHIFVVGRSESSSGVSAVSVAGQAAFSDDGFRTFRIEVALDPGSNSIPVETSGIGPAGAFVNPDAARIVVVRQSVVLMSPRDVVLDESGGRALMIDGSLAQLVAIDLTTGARQLISDATHGSGPAFSEPWGLAYDPSGARALVTNRGDNSVLAVSLVSGDRSLISDDLSAGPTLADPTGVVLDMPRNRALLIDPTRNGLYAVDLTNGTRTLISGGTTGSGPPFSGPRDLAIDVANQRAYVIDSDTATLYVVDLSNGTRFPLAGSGPFFVDPYGVELDLTANRALVGDGGLRAILSVDLTTGDRVIVSDMLTGSGPALVDPRNLARHASNGRLYAVDVINDALFEVDAQNGNRVLRAESHAGAGARFGGSWGVALNPVDPNAPAVVSDTFLESVFTVSPQNGDRNLLTGPGEPGPALDQPYAIAYDPSSNRVLATDPIIDALVAIDRNDGTRTLLSNATTGTGPAFNGPRGVAVVETGFAWVVDSGLNALLEVDLVTGDRTVLSDATVGSGPTFDEPWGVAAVNVGQALVIDSATLSIFVVNISDGAREELGAGPPDFVDPRAIAYGGRGEAYVADFGQAAIFRVSTGVGARGVLSGLGTGRGPKLVAPTGVAVHAKGFLIVVDNNDAVFAIEPFSGDRVYLSK